MAHGHPFDQLHQIDDHFGEIKPNYFVATGLGSNGFTLSPTLAF